MAYILGYLTVPMVIALLIVAFAIRPAYERKHGKKMGILMSLLCFVPIAFGILLVSLLGQMA